MQIKLPYLSICTVGVAPLLEKCRLTSRVVIFREKKFSGTRKRQKFIPLEFHLFCGSENARNSVPSHSAKNEKTQNSVPNHFVEDKKARNFIILFRTILWKKKMLGIPCWIILQKRKHSELHNFSPNHSTEDKKFWNLWWYKFEIFFLKTEWGNVGSWELPHNTNDSLLKGSINIFLKCHHFYDYMIKTHFWNLTSTG